MAIMRAKDPSHRSRYEIFSKALGDLDAAKKKMKGIDLRTCPPNVREEHRAARLAVDEAIRHCRAVCEGELDILNERS